MNGVQTRFKCKLDVKRCKRFVFPPSSLLPRSNALKTKAIRYFQTDRTLTRIVSPPLKEPRFAILTVDKAQAEGTVITLDGLTSLMDNNQDMFQVTQGKVREGLPMLRAEVRLIGKEGLTGAERDAQLAAFRELILDTNRQNFFIKVNGGKEIHMRGYAPTSAYKAEYEALVAGDTTLDANVYYSNTKGSTWGVKLPVGTRHAYERVPFREAYPDFTKWVDSKGASNQKWYENFVDEKTIRYW